MSLTSTSLNSSTTMPSSTSSSLGLVKDPKLLSSLQRVYETLIKDCIRLTNWQNIEQVNKHLQLLHRRILQNTETFFSKIIIDNPQQQLESSNGVENQPSAANIQSKTAQNSQISGNFENSGRRSEESDPPKECEEEELKRLQMGLQSSQNQSKKENKIKRKKERNSDSQSEDDLNPDGSDDSEEILDEGEYSLAPRLKHRFRRIPNPDSKNQCSDFRRQQYPDIGYSRSIENYPLAEKRRVIDFFNAHYDPAKRNKTDIVQKIVRTLHYSFNSINNLVSNQNPNNQNQNIESTSNQVAQFQSNQMNQLNQSYGNLQNNSVMQKTLGNMELFGE